MGYGTTQGYAGGGENHSSYSTDFSSATEFARNWRGGVWPNTPVVGNVNAHLPVIGLSTLGVNLLQWSIIGNAATNTMWPFYLVPKTPYGLEGVDHFAEVKFRQLQSTGGARIGAGLAVMSDPGAGPGARHYGLEVLSTTRAMYLYRNGGSGFTNFIAGFGSVADGDKMALVALIKSDRVTLNVYQNQALIATADDTTAQRLITGMPGLAGIDGPQGGGTVKNEMSHFRCGLASALGY